MASFDYIGVSEFAAMSNRSRQSVLKMVRNGILKETGYSIVPIHAKNQTKRPLRWAIGVPVKESKTTV